ncbi:MAG: NAD(P)-binding protein [Marinobacter sp.]|uniref:NAD(P)-binding protein n=1 Tax=Marinobacter sp. TaxID=50741 RepID=UPI00396DAFEF
MDTKEGLDLIIVGGGIGGVICLKYAKDAGLNALLLERGECIGGLWRDLPSWQDIQFRKEDWTLGTLPLARKDQTNILGNISADAPNLFPLAPQDRESYPFGIWYLRYLWLALFHPWKRPMPITRNAMRASKPLQTCFLRSFVAHGHQTAILFRRVDTCLAC